MLPRVFVIGLFAAILPILVIGMPGTAEANDQRGRFIAAHICETSQRLHAVFKAPRKSTKSPDWQDRFLVSGRRSKPEAYVQCIMSPSQKALRCEAASGRFLKDKTIETALFAGDGPARLAALGFSPPEGDGNYWMTRSFEGEANDVRAVAKLILEVLFDVYGPLVDTQIDFASPLIEPFAPSCKPVS